MALQGKMCAYYSQAHCGFHSTLSTSVLKRSVHRVIKPYWDVS